MRLLNFLTKTADISAFYDTTDYPDTASEQPIGIFDFAFDWMRNQLSLIMPETLAYTTTSIIRAILIIVVGYMMLKIAKRVLRKLVRKLLAESVVATFAASVVTAVLYVIYLLAVLAALGISTAGLAAFMAASGLAIGLALQGSLGNIANGVVLLMVKPFKVGDLVNIDGIDGVVKEINLATTLIDTPDNHCVTLPNTLVATNRIINYHRNDLRRMDLSFNIAHGHSSDFIKKLLNNIVESHADISKEIAPTIAVGNVTSSYTTYFFRPWVKSKKFLTLRFDILEKVANKFKENNVHMEVDKVVVNTGSNSLGDMNLDTAVKKTPRASMTKAAEEKLAVKAVAATKPKPKAK